ncbi:NAD(P)H-binding protein [Jidongwangia harbinensis]|uniref:NAD(P)H-binding protein n=1 Tax=Jidongwangia harbinensis TaxID=2878561 RepID=UPI001CD9CF6B|nr:NAD(P)H-binding protein [Jidongwangia harbinensis]MCA2218927.1 NAD(P)H-binding protein [Jidongwangia harbinensis]
MTRTVLVTGARGKTGREVVRRLRHADVVVRAGSSRPAGEPSPSVRPVRFDWSDPSTWPEAVDGVDAIYLMRPDRPDAPDLAARLVGLRPTAHVVLLSEQGAERMPAGHWARRVEDAVVAGAAGWTLLRPSWFHQVLTDARFYRDSIRTDRVFGLPSGGAPIAWVDARDIAAVAVAALGDPGRHHARAYTLTGPAVLTVEEVAAELSAQLGQPVRADDPPVRQAIEGLDAWTADLYAEVFDRVRRGDFAETSPAVAEVTGTPPVPMRAFVAEHLGEWRAG